MTFAAPDADRDGARDVDVVVLGAGPAGLAAGLYAARRGLRVVVLDRAPVVGGLARSIEVGGRTVDLGSHRLHPSIDASLLADLRGLLGDELQWRPRNGRVRLRGRWLRFPFRPLDVVRHADKRFAAAVGRDLIASPVRSRRAAGPDTFAGLVRRGLGPAIASAFYDPYARKLWDCPPDELSGELFRRRVSARTGASIVRRLVRRGPAPGFWYPAGGFGRISEALADGVQASGGELSLGVDVHAARLPASPDGCVRVDTSAGSFTARTLISTIPTVGLTVAAAAPDHVVAASQMLRHRAAVVAYLAVAGAQYTPFDAHYFPESSVRMARLSEPKNYRAAPADPLDTTVLCAELPATVGDDLWSRSDGDITALVLADLRSVGLPSAEIVGAHVERQAHVYPVYTVGFERHQAVVEAWAAQQPGLALVGRQALFAHDNTHHTLAMGRAVARCLGSDGTLDRSAWTAARSSFADHVVED